MIAKENDVRAVFDIFGNDLRAVCFQNIHPLGTENIRKRRQDHDESEKE